VDPVTLAVIGGAASGIGNIIGAFGANKRAKAERGAMKSQMKFLGNQRQQVDEMFGMKLDQFDQQGESFLSSQQKNLGLSGVSMEGSPLLAMAQSEQNLAQDREMIERERTMELAGIDQEVDQLRRGKKANKKASRWNMASSLLGAAGSTASGISGPLLR
jgi:hypothetical protein